MYCIYVLYIGKRGIWIPTSARLPLLDTGGGSVDVLKIKKRRMVVYTYYPFNYLFQLNYLYELFLFKSHLTVSGIRSSEIEFITSINTLILAATTGGVLCLTSPPFLSSTCMPVGAILGLMLMLSSAAMSCRM